MIRNVATVHLLCKHTLLLQCLHKLCHRFSRSWQCTEVRSILTCHFDIWRTQFPGLLSPKTCKTCHLSRVPLPSLPHLHCLFPVAKYLYYYATSSPNRFSMVIPYMLLVTFIQVILYEYNHISSQNAIISRRLTSRHGVSSGCGWRYGPLYGR